MGIKLASNQPYFFPYLGYFGLIKHTDKWIVFDTPQYISQGWINRNRILKPIYGWQYINVPIKKHSSKTSIKDIKIINDKNWVKLILSKLIVYKKFAPFYKEVLNVVEKSLSIETDNITNLNCNIIQEVCKYLGIEWDYEVFSQMNLNFKDVNDPDEWALYICKNMENVSEYWNLPGGASFYNSEKFRNNNITIKFYNQILVPYNQKRGYFEPGLSIIDVMMFNSVTDINKMFDDFCFV